MLVYILVQETQSSGGYIDTTNLEAFTEERLALASKLNYESDARLAGQKVEGDEDVADGDWEVSYRVEEIEVFRAPITSIESQVYIDSGELPQLEEQVNFTEDERSTLNNALKLAVEVYQRHADTSKDAGFPRIADQFTSQIASANALAARIEEED